MAVTYSESVFVTLSGNVEVFKLGDCDNILSAWHCIYVFPPCKGDDTPYHAECGVLYVVYRAKVLPQPPDSKRGRLHTFVWTLMISQGPGNKIPDDFAMHSPMPGGAEGNGMFLSTSSYVTAPGIGLFFMISGALLLPIKEDCASHGSSSCHIAKCGSEATPGPGVLPHCSATCPSGYIYATSS